MVSDKLGGQQQQRCNNGEFGREYLVDQGVPCQVPLVHCHQFPGVLTTQHCLLLHDHESPVLPVHQSLVQRYSQLSKLSVSRKAFFAACQLS